MKKLQVIKIGGSILDDVNTLEKFFSDFSRIGDLKVLVHGGGRLATDIAQMMGVKQKMVHGRRITDAKTLDVVVMVYAGLINKRIVAGLQKNNCNALGLSGADLGSIIAVKRNTLGLDYGFAGDIDSVDLDKISFMLESGFVPVFCPITASTDGQLLNTNADTIASALAISLSNLYEVQLNYCLEMNGVLKDLSDPASLIPKLDKAAFRMYEESGLVSKGMLPKLENAFHALEHGVNSVRIGHASQISKLIKRAENAGTELIN
jgi:acetylglutamate kinase